MAENKKNETKEKPLSLADRRAKSCGLEPDQVYTARACGGLHLPKTPYRNEVKPGDLFKAEGREIAGYAGRVEIETSRGRFKRVESEEMRRQEADVAKLRKRTQARAMDNHALRLHRALMVPNHHEALLGVQGRPPEFVQRIREYCDAAELVFASKGKTPKASGE